VHKTNLLNGSTKSLRKWLGYLRSYSLINRFAWLDAADNKAVKDVITKLEFQDLSPIVRASPLTNDIISAIITCNSIHPMLKCLIAVGHDGLLRGSELCSGLKVANIQWSSNRRAATFFLNRTKTHRSGGPVLVIIKDYGVKSGIALLRHHFSTNCLWNKHDSFVFPYFTSRSINWSLPLTVDQLRRRIKSTMCYLNIDPRGFGTHSLRAGGATDLFRAAVPYPIIKKYGR
jgi:integrase